MEEYVVQNVELIVFSDGGNLASAAFIYVRTPRVSLILKKKTPLVKQRIINPSATQNLISDLYKSGIYNKLNKDLCAYPNDNYNLLIDTIYSLKEIHMPYKLVKFDKHKHTKNKWITFGIIKEIFLQI